MPAAITFFALRDDLAGLLEFLLEKTEVRLFEAYSRFDQPLREFASVDAVEHAFRLGIDEDGTGATPFLQLWWPAVGPPPRIERIALQVGAVPGHTFRHAVHGWGLAQLQCGGAHGEVITKSHFGHFTQAGARKAGYTDDDSDGPIDWSALQRVSRRVQRELRTRLAGGRVRGRGPVLAAAAARVRAGASLKESARAPWTYEMEHDQAV